MKKRILSIGTAAVMSLSLLGSVPTQMLAADSFAKTLKVSSTSVSVDENESVKITAKVKVKGKVTKKVTAVSSDKTVARVKVGKLKGKKTQITITGVGEGSATVKVKTNAKGKSGKALTKKIRVTVNAVSDNPTPQVDPVDVIEMSTGSFAADMYRTMQGDSFVFSPYSIMDCLTLAYDGYSDEAKAALAAEGITEETVEAFAAFDKYSQYDDTINVANKIYLNKDRAATYNTDLLRADFFELIEMNSEAAKTMNDWIAEQTKDHIQNLIPEDAISKDTALSLINALYFKRSWDYNHTKIEWTEDGEYYDAFCGETSIYSAKDVDGITVLKLYYDRDWMSEYDQDSVAMYFITEDETGEVSPDEWIAGDPDLDAALDFTDYEGLSGYTDVEFFIPSYETKFQDEVTDSLKAIGLQPLFDDDSMAAIGQEMKLSNVFHGGYIKVDETGTEAAAATAAMAVDGAAPGWDEPVYRTIKIDKPFIFVMKDETRGNILFMGRVDKDALTKYSEGTEDELVSEIICEYPAFDDASLDEETDANAVKYSSKTPTYAKEIFIPVSAR